MNIEETNRLLLEQARALGICDKFLEEWTSVKTVNELADMMYRGLDFCLEHHWPSNEFLVRHFSIEYRRSAHIFVDDEYSVVNPRESIALGTSSVTYRYNGWSIGIIHIRDNSTARIIAKGKSHVIVHLHESANASVECEALAEVVIITHSKNVTFSGNPTRVKMDS